MPHKIIQLPLLQIAGTNIEFIDNFNFIGLTINKHLTWTSHINILSAKISKTIGVLKSLKHFLPTDILRTVYNSLIVCHLNYGILLRGTQLAENDKLHKLLKRAVRIITSNSYLSHSEPLFAQLCRLKSCDIYKCQLLKFIFKLVHKQLPQYFIQIQFIFNNQQHQQKGPVTPPPINEKRGTRNEKRETRNEKRETRNEKREIGRSGHTATEKRETRNGTVDQ